MHNPSAPSQGHNQKPAGHTPFSVQRTRPAGQTQQVRAAARKNPKGPTSLSVQRPSPGRARLAEFPRPQAGKKMKSCLLRRPQPAGGERKWNHVLTGSAGQNIPLTPRVPASPARFGVHPPILGGATGQAEHPTPPYTALPNEAPTFRAPPKIPYLIRILGSIY